MTTRFTACALAALVGVAAGAEPSSRGQSALNESTDQLDRGQARGESLRNLALRLQREALSDWKNVSRRAEAEGVLREALAEGAVSPFEVITPGIVEELFNAPGARALTIDSTGGLSPQRLQQLRAVNPHPWAGQIAFGEDFEDPIYTKHTSLSALADLVPLAGQQAPNGEFWKTSSTQIYDGLVDNSIAQTGPNWDPAGTGFEQHGVVGGPDPDGVQGTFFAEPRGSIYTLTSTAYNSGFHWAARLNHEFYAPAPAQPVVTIVDWYMDRLDTFTWYRPAANGLILTNMFMGGLNYDTFVAFVNEDNHIDRPILLGLKPGGFSESEYFVGEHVLKTREWFQVAMRQSVDTVSFWIRDSETRGANPSGVPYDAPGFEGEVFDTEWVQIYPGIEDDPGTPQIEGAGLCRDEFNQSPERVVGSDGNLAGYPFYAMGVSNLQTVGGFDPYFYDVPLYQPNDWYFDNYSVIGESYSFPAVYPPLTLPYVDDFELWGQTSALLQAGRWYDYYAYGAFTEAQNHTSGIGLDGEPATQSLQMTNLHADSIYRQGICIDLEYERLTARATSEKDITIRAWARINDHNTSFGLRLCEVEDAAQIFIGGRDEVGGVDDRLYLALPNPDYDPDVVEDDVSGVNVVWDGAQNRAMYPTPLRRVSDGAPATVPTDEWFEIEVRVDVDAGDSRGDVTVLLDGSELEVDSSFYASLGATAPSTENVAWPFVNKVYFECGYEKNGQSSKVWWDDILLDGASVDVPTPLSVDASPFSDHPPYAIPYIEPFDGYERDLPLNGQGSSPHLAELLTDSRDEQIDLIPLNHTIAMGDPVYLYLIDEIVSDNGSLPSEIMTGATIGALDTIPDPLDPRDEESPGRTGNSRPLRILDSMGVVVGIVNATLQSATSSPWDGVTPIVGEYFFEFQPRWWGDDSAPVVRSIESEHAGHGDALVITQDGASSQYTGYLYRAIEGELPFIEARLGRKASLSFDLFIESDTSAPRGRTVWEIRDRQYKSYGRRCTHGAFAFGGPNIYEDRLDNFTLASGPDGDPDDMHTDLQSDPSHLYILRRNTIDDDPLGLWEDTGFVMPINSWMRVSFELTGALGTTFEIRDASGATLFSETGLSFQYDGADATMEGLKIDWGADPGGGGRPALEPITFTSLGTSVAPELGPDPDDDHINSLPPKYLYYSITDIDPFETPDFTSLPDIIEVDYATGIAVGQRDLDRGDIVVIANDTGTGSGDPTGELIAQNHPRNDRWRYAVDDMSPPIAGGRWQPLGIVYDNGFYRSLPNGGVTNTAPPYNGEPAYQTILMGELIDLPPYPATTAPHRVMIDNLVLEYTGCLMDITGDGVVDGADLALLLASWGVDDPSVDANADGVIDGADLAAMLAEWGLCE